MTKVISWRFEMVFVTMYKIRTPNYEENTYSCSDAELIDHIKRFLLSHEFVTVSYNFDICMQIERTLANIFLSIDHIFLHPSNIPYTDMLTIYKQ